MTTIHILGCHHALQSVEICKRWTDWRELYEMVGKDVDKLAREQKDHFVARIRQIVHDRVVTVIGEESDEGVATSASLVVQNWHMIDMPSAVRVDRGIPDDYADPDAGYTQKERADWNLQREHYMFDEFLQHGGNANSALIICGSEHINGLTRKFADAGHTVTSEDVTAAGWFDPPPG
jgi:hypothetical protein